MMRDFFKKHLVLFLALIFVYGSYLVTSISHRDNAHVLGAQANLFLLEEPLDGKQPILSVIDSATKEIDTEVYLLSDKDIISHFLSACQRGVIVKILLEEHPFGGGTINQKTKQTLDGTCIQLHWTNPAFSLTHEKTIVIDGQQALILNQNLTTSSFEKNREYDIFDANRNDVEEIEKIFSSDWTRTVYTSQASSNILVSPATSRNALVGLITSATTSIDIEMEVINDPEIISLLVEQAKQHRVRIILPSFSQLTANKKIAQQLKNGGVYIETLTSPYIHAKLIIVDDRKAYIGSINLTSQSMDENREVGIFLTQQDILSQLSSDFTSDWERATAM